jgi:hypothetical protein
VIFELEIKKRSDVVYEWTLERFPAKVGEGSGTDVSAVLLAPFRGGLARPGDRWQSP